MEKFLLFSWVILGFCLRFLNLDLKSPSSIEVATLGFSLGHGFKDIPVNKIISLEQLLQPLKFDYSATVSDVITHLMNESTHPPFYFLLTHFWLKLFAPDNVLIELWMGRSLSAILGVLAILVIYWLANLIFRDPIVAQIAAALMAVSPYGIYLAQEARHYTLTILWIMVSLACLIVAIEAINQQKKFSLPWVFIWILVNGLGIASHYFFVLALAGEVIVLGWVWWQKKFEISLVWQRISLTILGSLIGCLVWIPYLQAIADNELTEWISTSFNWDKIFLPLIRLLGWWISTILLLPVEGVNLAIVIGSILVLLSLLVWSAPSIIAAFKTQLKNDSSWQYLSLLLVAVITIFLLIIYGQGKDLSLAARYHFVYFPLIILLLAAALGINWKNGAKKIAIAFILMGLLGGLTVVYNYGFQKSRRSDLFVEQIKSQSQVPVLIAMNYKTHAEIRTLMAIAFDCQRFNFLTPKFSLVETEKNLDALLAQLPKPLDLWTINLILEDKQLQQINCTKALKKKKINGYRYRIYNCHCELPQL